MAGEKRPVAAVSSKDLRARCVDAGPCSGLALLTANNQGGYGLSFETIMFLWKDAKTKANRMDTLRCTALRCRMLGKRFLRLDFCPCCGANLRRMFEAAEKKMKAPR